MTNSPQGWWRSSGLWYKWNSRAFISSYHSLYEECICFHRSVESWNVNASYFPQGFQTSWNNLVNAALYRQLCTCTVALGQIIRLFFRWRLPALTWKSQTRCWGDLVHESTLNEVVVVHNSTQVISSWKTDINPALLVKWSWQGWITAKVNTFYFFTGTLQIHSTLFTSSCLRVAGSLFSVGQACSLCVGFLFISVDLVCSFSRGVLIMGHLSLACDVLMSLEPSWTFQIAISHITCYTVSAYKGGTMLECHIVQLLCISHSTTTQIKGVAATNKLVMWMGLSIGPSVGTSESTLATYHWQWISSLKLSIIRETGVDDRESLVQVSSHRSDQDQAWLGYLSSCF